MKDKLGNFLVNWRVKKIIPYLNGKTIDIGCGTNQLIHRYKNGLGVDVYQWGNVDLIVKDSSILPFDQNSFDTATIIASLNHIPNRENVLKEVNRILKPEGRIIITMLPPFISKLWHKIRNPWDADQQERKMKKGEVFGLTKSEIRKMFVGANFRIVKTKKFMFFINNIIIGEKTNNP